MSDFNSNQSFEERGSERRDTNPGWVAGGILILLGFIFLVKNLTGFGFDNWWALFILIPAFSAFSRAYQMYRNEGRLGSEARGSLLGGFFLTALAFAFLFGISIGAWWPVLLILAGLAILGNALLPK